MAEHYIGALDQGTTSTRFIIFDTKCGIVAMHQLEHEQITPHPGWTEHDPMEILRCSKQCIDECIRTAGESRGIKPSQIKAIGITNQRETTLLWDRNTGQPLVNAIVWHDARTGGTAASLRKKYSSKWVQRISGLPISTYFSGVKLRWLLDNSEKVRKAVENGTAMFGTIDTWLVYNLSHNKAHVTDVTNAGRTMLMNIKTLDWDDKLLKMIGISRDILPEIRSCSEVYGDMVDTVLKGVPIAGLIGDQQAALVGQTCFEVGEGKNTYGTGCFLIVNTGLEPKFSNNHLLTTPAYKIGPDQDCVYSIEGSVANAGAAVQWLRDQIKMIKKASEIETLASSVEDTGDVYCVPAFSGLFAPRWREDARGTIVGVTQFTNKAHIARALLESIAFQVDDVLKAVSQDMGAPLTELRVDGGASVNNLLLEMQANITGTDVVRPKVVETTALGAAFCAGHAVGLFQSIDEFRESWDLDQRFQPQITEEERQTTRCKWEAAVERSLGWVEAGERSQWCSFLTKEVVFASIGSAFAAAAITALSCMRSRK